MIEVWKTHPEFTDYAVSDMGRVKRLTAKQGARPGHVLRPGVGGHGYALVVLNGRSRKVHALVLETFLGARPEGAQARHKNDQKTDNRLENLEWGTRSENYADRVRNGGGNHGSRHGMSKLSERAVLLIRDEATRGVSHRSIAARHGISKSYVYQISHRLRWAHI